MSLKPRRHLIPALTVLGVVWLNSGGAFTAAQSGEQMPVFEVDTAWPPKLPYNWIMGHVASVAVDSRDHVFLLHRPNTIPPEDRARSAPPPTTRA